MMRQMIIEEVERLGQVVSMQPLRGGRVAEHNYVVHLSDGRRLTAKVVKANEAVILRVLAHLRSPLVPRICSVQSLDRMLLLWDFVDAQPWDVLHPGTAQEYARFQNATDSGDVFRTLGLAGQVKLDKGGYKFYAQTFDRCLEAARSHLCQLQEQEWPVLAVVREAVSLIIGKTEGLREAFAGSPFGWLHNDFREQNLVGNPQKLIDWGSSYGYGPYLYDVASFLIEDDMALGAFTRESQAWQMRSAAAREVDLSACAATALLGLLNWHLGDLLNDGDLTQVEQMLTRRQRQFGRLCQMLR